MNISQLNDTLKETSPTMATSLEYNVKLLKFQFCTKGDGGSDQLIKKAICDVWTFLKDFIPLANTHGAEFITHKHWEKFIPSPIQQELLTLNEEELVNLPLGKCETTPSKFKDDEGTSKSTCIQFEAAGHLKNRLYPRGSAKIESNKFVSDCDIQDHISDTSSACIDNGLNLFVSKACECHLENLGILTSSEEIMNGQKQSKSIIAEAMSDKKRHEVQVISDTISAMVRVHGADLVVDVGSGKGYLGMELADHQSISVLGLDSSATNTHGAKVRKKKLTPRWSRLVAKEDRKIKGEKNEWEDFQEYSETVNDSFSGKPTKTQNRQADTRPLEALSLPHEKIVETSCQLNIDRGEISILTPAKTVDISNLYVPLTMNVNPEMNLRQVLCDHCAHLCGDDEKIEEIKFILSGLHTCGSLAVDTIRLFVKDAGAVGMCSVGCCYQLLDEQSEECEGDFPMSQYGKSLNLCLGRNARNLASQSVHRLRDSKQLQGKDFYWRALLDVLFRDLSLPVPERIMGMRKLNKQCKTFYEYAVKALEKLGLSSHKISPKWVQTLEDNCQHEQIKMAAFFQYKLVLAPVIESLILLDRLLFLKEQDCVGQAFLVKLFDPVTSPRCYALMAHKAKSSNAGDSP